MNQDIPIGIPETQPLSETTSNPGTLTPEQ